jgi:hypothetical protein
VVMRTRNVQRRERAGGHAPTRGLAMRRRGLDSITFPAAIPTPRYSAACPLRPSANRRRPHSVLRAAIGRPARARVSHHSNLVTPRACSPSARAVFGKTRTVRAARSPGPAGERPSVPLTGKKSYHEDVQGQRSCTPCRGRMMSVPTGEHTRSRTGLGATTRLTDEPTGVCDEIALLERRREDR